MSGNHSTLPTHSALTVAKNEAEIGPLETGQKMHCNIIHIMRHENASKFALLRTPKNGLKSGILEAWMKQKTTFAAG